MKQARNRKDQQAISKKKVLKKAINLTWDQFSSTSTIHGIPHINDIRANNITRIFWVTMVLVCFMCANALLATFIIRYKSNPVRLNIQTSHEPVGDLYFPGVVFCNANFLTNLQTKRMMDTLELSDATTEYSAGFDNITDYFTPLKKKKMKVEELLGLISGFVEKISTHNIAKNLQQLQDILLDNRYNIDSAMQKLMYPCTDLMRRCRWAGEIVDCKKIFKPTETSNGYCCGFNIIPATRSKSKQRSGEAVKNYLAGVENGLSVVLRPLLEEGAVATVDSEGVKMFINDYDLYPYEVSILKMLPHRMETLVELKVEETTNSAAVQGLPITDRGCYFEDEYNLRFFKKYSIANCEAENRMETTYELCECIPYYYYKVDGMDVCNFTKIECLVNHFDSLKVLTNEVNVSTVHTCIPQCDFVTLNTHITSVPLETNTSRAINSDYFYYGLTSEDMVAHVYWKSQTFRVYRRDLLTNIISLISNLGGVYSLLVGMSILSVIEVVYYGTIRLFLNYRNFRNEERKAKTFTKRLDVFDNLRVPLDKIPRLDTARISTRSSRMTPLSHF